MYIELLFTDLTCIYQSNIDVPGNFYNKIGANIFSTLNLIQNGSIFLNKVYFYS